MRLNYGRGRKRIRIREEKRFTYIPLIIESRRFEIYEVNNEENMRARAAAGSRPGFFRYNRAASGGISRSQSLLQKSIEE